jgi:hypothetical protein
MSIKINRFADELAFLEVIIFGFSAANYNLGIARNCR